MVDEATRPPIQNALAGIVITAQTWNPSIFTETWLVHNRIVVPKAFAGLRLSSPEVSQFQFGETQLLVVPPSMQINFSIQGGSEGSVLARTMATRVVQLLPHTPYQGLGLNFLYFLTEPRGVDFNSYVRALLGGGSNKLLGHFSSADARFGRYFSKNYEAARLKLDIKPVQAGPEKKGMLLFSFNFHHEVSPLEQEARVETIVKSIESWGALRAYAENLVQLGSVM